MSNRALAGLLMILFAVLLYISLRDTLQLVAGGQYGGVPLLLFCASACVAWIVFLAALEFASVAAQQPRLHAPLPRA
jgi:hypothetical protein